MIKATKLILVDLSGHVVLKDATKREVYEFVHGKKYKTDNNAKSILKSKFIKYKYISFRQEHPEELYEKLKNLILVLSKDKKEILGFYTSIKEVKRDKNLDLYSSAESLSKILKSGERSPADKVYLITGEKALEMMKSKGYLDEVEKLINEGKGEDNGGN